MASAAVNGIPAPPLSPESFLECCAAAASPAARGWLSPRISFSLDLDDHLQQHAAEDGLPVLTGERSGVVGKGGAGGFEFRLEDSISMLPADELFSDGKLLPLYLAAIRPAVEQAAAAAAGEVAADSEGLVLEGENSAPEAVVVAESLPDPYLFSPKAPRCSTRWRELLRLKKAALAAALSSKVENKADTSTASSSTASSSSSSSNVRKLRFFLHRNPKSAPIGSDPSLSLPLLHTSPESDPVPTSSRPSSPDRLDLPRLSLDSERPSQKHASAAAAAGCSGTPPRPRSSYKCSSRARPLPDHPPVRSGRSSSRRAPEEAAPRRGVSVDSPRMNPSGKIVFHGLERSSSSPGSFNGGPRPKHRPMERSYSANVRVAPVINIIGFGPLFSSSSSSQKKDAGAKARGKVKASSAIAKVT